MSIVVNKTRLPVTEWQTASGSVVSIANARRRDAKSAVVTLEPIQDLHGYSSPWVGGAGVNAMPNAVAKTETQNGITISTNGDGIYRFSGTALSDAIIVFPLSVSFTIPSGNASTGTHSAFFMNTDISSTNVTLCFMNGSVQIDSLAMSPKNRIATSYNAMSNKVCDGIKFIIRSGTSVSGTISPMFVAKGTPTNTPFSPYENLCPISGHSSVTAVRDGKNLLELYLARTSHNGVDYSLTSDGKLHVDGTASPANSYSGGNYSTYALCPWKFKAGTYTISADFGQQEGFSGFYLCFSTRKKSDNSQTNFTVYSYGSGSAPKEVSINEDFGAWFWVVVPNGKTVVTDVSLQLETGSPTSSFVPFTGTSITVQLGQTVYGGSVDLVSGVGTLTHKSVTFIGDDAYWWYTYDPSNYDSFCFNVDLPDKKIKKLTSICDKYRNVENSWGAGGNGIFDVFSDHATLARLYFRQPYYGFGNTVQDWKTWLSSNPLQVCYELATPITFQLTPNQLEMLERNNTLWADEGEIELTYARIHQ